MKGHVVITGDKITVGMTLAHTNCGKPLRVNGIRNGRHVLGASYADCKLEDGGVKRCWHGFKYSIINPFD